MKKSGIIVVLFILLAGAAAAYYVFLFQDTQQDQAEITVQSEPAFSEPAPEESVQPAATDAASQQPAAVSSESSQTEKQQQISQYWQERAIELQSRFADNFTPPNDNEVVVLHLVNGESEVGQLKEVTPQTVTITDKYGVKVFKRDELATRTRIQLFIEDFTEYETIKQIRKEARQAKLQQS